MSNITFNNQPSCDGRIIQLFTKTSTLVLSSIYAPMSSLTNAMSLSYSNLHPVLSQACVLVLSFSRVIPSVSLPYPLLPRRE